MQIQERQFVTELEKQVILNIINSEYMNADDDDMIDFPVWSFTATNFEKSLAGALGSLVKKELCFCQLEGKDETCGLTREGYYWALHNGLL